MKSSLFRIAAPVLVALGFMIMTPLVGPLGTVLADSSCSHTPYTPYNFTGGVAGRGIISCSGYAQRTLGVQLKEELSWEPDPVVRESSVKDYQKYADRTASRYMTYDPDGDYQSYFTKAFSTRSDGQYRSKDSSRYSSHYEWR